MKNLKLLLLIPLLGFVTSCDQDPYPTDKVIRTTQFQEPEPTLPPVSIEPIEDLNFTEGLLSTFKIRVTVEEPGEPILTVENLPEGASFDEETFTLSWQPGYFDANDANNPTVDVRTYPITFYLRSTALPNDGDQRTVKLVVSDSPRPITLDTRSVTPQVDENEEFERIVRFNNLDFPEGPFRISFEDLPAGLDYDQVDGNTFRLKFKPDFFHVNRETEGKSFIRYAGKIVAVNPANQTRKFDYRIQVNDVRQGVEFSAPEEIEQGLDAGFQVAAFDLNREIAPDLDLSVNKPPYGNFTTTLEQNPETFSTVLNILWKDIPPIYNNTTQDVSYTACVLDSNGRKTNCKTQSTKIKIELKDRTPPTINRDNWKVGELIYLGFNEEIERFIRIIDNEDIDLRPKVEIFPEEMRKFVKLNWVRLPANPSDNLKGRARLKLKFKKAGTFQFNLKATSDYNVSSAESFIVEVFPENRNKTLIFADSTRDKEVLFYKERFKESMDLMNPAIQTVNQRNISGREKIVITTSTLLDPTNQKEILAAIDKIEDVVIASSLFDKLPESFLEMLKKEYDLRVIGRYSRLNNPPPLANMRIMTTRLFDTPQNDVKLKLDTTSASADPIIFNGGLDEPNKKCLGVMGLTENGESPYRLGVSCKRKGGGSFSFLGTEWADLKTSDADADIPESWFNTLLNDIF